MEKVTTNGQQVLKYIFTELWNEEMKNWWIANISDVMDILPDNLKDTNVNKH